MMTKGVKAGIIALLLIATFSVAAIIGHFVLKDNSYSTTRWDRIDYACEIAYDMEGFTYHGSADPRTREIKRDFDMIGTLLEVPELSRTGFTMQSEQYGEFLFFADYSYSMIHAIDEYGYFLEYYRGLD